MMSKKRLLSHSLGCSIAQLTVTTCGSRRRPSRLGRGCVPSGRRLTWQQDVSWPRYQSKTVH